MSRTFSVDVQVGQETKTVDLIEGGSQIYVNMENRDEFVRKFIEFEVYVQAESRLEAFWKGLSRFIDSIVLRELFETEELPILVCGQ